MYFAHGINTNAEYYNHGQLYEIEDVSAGIFSIYNSTKTFCKVQGNIIFLFVLYEDGLFYCRL